MVKINSEIQDLVFSFRNEIGDILGDKLFGLYLYNSAARGEFEPEASDIDFIVVLNELLNGDELELLRTVHKKLANDYRYGNKLDGMYLQLSDIGKINSKIGMYPYAYHSDLVDSGNFDVNYVTWWSLKTDGLPINSPSITHLLEDIVWSNVETTLEYNFNKYWKSKLSQEDLFLEDMWVEFGICTVSRIIYSIEQKQIISKTNACHYIADKDDRWQDVINEALNLRTGSKLTGINDINLRKRRTVEFINHMIEHGNRLLGNGTA